MLYRLDRVLEYLSALEQGATRESAAPLLGLTAGRLEQILALGRVEFRKYGVTGVDTDEVIEKGEGEAGRLLLYTLRSEARAEQQMTAALWSSAINGNWKAAQTILERRFPQRWARVDRVDAQTKLPSAQGKQQKPQKPGLSQASANTIRRDILGIKKKPETPK